MSTSAKVRLVQDLTQIHGASPSVSWILCPWLQQFAGESDIWLSVLAAHDANRALLEALPPSKKRMPHVYAAVFAVDVLRTTAHLIHHIKNSGVDGVINLPSVSFIDGQAGAVLDGLSLGVERELDFLETCAKNGLRIAGVVGSVQSAKRLLAAGVDFLIAHDGPPVGGEKDSGKRLAMKLAELVRSKSVPIIPMSQLLRTHILKNLM